MNDKFYTLQFIKKIAIKRLDLHDNERTYNKLHIVSARIDI